MAILRFLALIVPSERGVTDQRSKKIRDRQLAAPAESESLQSLVVNELKTKKHTATEGLLWLVRYISLSMAYRTDASHTSNSFQRSRLHRARVTAQYHKPIRRTLHIIQVCVQLDPKTLP